MCANKYMSICFEWKAEGEEAGDFGIASRKEVSKQPLEI